MDIGAIFTQPGYGSVIVLSVYTLAMLIFVGLTRWIIGGGKTGSKK
ncbi:MAG: hypothetical protein AB1649_32415 [Chloroflexota bacterium]